MSGVPDVSVVVPTRNRGGVIADTVDAALAQHGVEVEVLVVDDGSTDETWAWLSARASEPRLRPLRHTVNRGVAAARNTGSRQRGAAASRSWTTTISGVRTSSRRSSTR